MIPLLASYALSVLGIWIASSIGTGAAWVALRWWQKKHGRSFFAEVR